MVPGTQSWECESEGWEPYYLIIRGTVWVAATLCRPARLSAQLKGTSVDLTFLALYVELGRADATTLTIQTSFLKIASNEAGGERTARRDGWKTCGAEHV